MNTTEATSTPTEGQQVLALAVAHWIERLSKEEAKELIAQANLASQKEQTALQQRIKQLEDETAQQRQTIEKLEADKVRLYHEISRSLFNPKDYENFDPSEHTVPAEEMLAAARKRLQSAS